MAQFQPAIEEEEAFEILSYDSLWELVRLHSSSVIFSNKLYFSFNSRILNYFKFYVYSSLLTLVISFYGVILLPSELLNEIVEFSITRSELLPEGLLFYLALNFMFSDCNYLSFILSYST